MGGSHKKVVKYTWQDDVESENAESIQLLNLGNVCDQFPDLLIPFINGEDAGFDEIDLSDGVGSGHLRKLLNDTRYLCLTRLRLQCLPLFKKLFKLLSVRWRIQINDYYKSHNDLLIS
jgi:hypothetical protein